MSSKKDLVKWRSEAKYALRRFRRRCLWCGSFESYEAVEPPKDPGKWSVEDCKEIIETCQVLMVIQEVQEPRIPAKNCRRKVK